MDVRSEERVPGDSERTLKGRKSVDDDVGVVRDDEGEVVVVNADLYVVRDAK